MKVFVLDWTMDDALLGADGEVADSYLVDCSRDFKRYGTAMTTAFMDLHVKAIRLSFVFFNGAD